VVDAIAATPPHEQPGRRAIRLTIPAAGGRRFGDVDLVVPDASHRLLLASRDRLSAAPVVTLPPHPAQAFSEDDGPVRVAESLSVRARGSAPLTSATITLTNPLNDAAERLSVDAAPLAADYDPARSVLRITGAASAERYQQVLRSLSYDNLSQDPQPEPRSIKVVVRDDRKTSRAAVTTLDIQPRNDPPDLHAVADREAALAQSLMVALTAVDPESGDRLTFRLDPDESPAGAVLEQLDNDTAVVRWTPTQSDLPGPARFRVLVTDDAEIPAADSEAFSILLQPLLEP
jgi:hypothetical protein